MAASGFPHRALTLSTAHRSRSAAPSFRGDPTGDRAVVRVLQCTLMIGHTLAHYGILERIGSGGMSKVYRARDTRPERDVSLVQAG